MFPSFPPWVSLSHLCIPCPAGWARSVLTDLHARNPDISWLTVNKGFQQVYNSKIQTVRQSGSLLLIQTDTADKVRSIREPVKWLYGFLQGKHYVCHVMFHL